MLSRNTLKRFFLVNSENNILYTIFGLITLCIIGIYLIHPDVLSNNTQYDAQILLVNVQILATILAITTSFTILGLQYVSQDLTPRIMSYYIKSKEFLFFFGLYGFGIISNLFVASFPKIISPSQFLCISYLLLVFCIFSLIIYLKFLIIGLQSTTIIENIEKNIPVNFQERIIRLEGPRKAFRISSNDPFVELEQIIIRSIRNNDYTTFSYCLQRIVSLNYGYLKKIGLLNVDSGYSEVWKKTYALQNYFLRLYNQIRFEIINQNNERFLIEYLQSITFIISYLFELKSDASIEQLDNQFEEIGKLIVEKKYCSVCPEYGYALSDLLELEFSNLPSGNMSPIYSDPIFDINTLSEKEKDLWYFGERTHSHFFSELSFCTDLIEKGHSEEFYSIFFSIIHTIEQLIITSFKNPYNEVFRRALLYRLFITYLKIHEIALKNNGFSDNHLSLLLMDINYKPQEYGVAFLKDILLEFFRAQGDLSIKYDDPSGIRGIGVGSRFLIHHFPDITSGLVDLLIEYSKKIPQAKELKKVSLQLIKEELKSIKSLNKQNIKEINRKIDDTIIQMES
jgi:hypothetical protein